MLCWNPEKETGCTVVALTELWTESQRGGKEAGTCAGRCGNKKLSEDIWTKQMEAGRGSRVKKFGVCFFKKKKFAVWQD